VTYTVVKCAQRSPAWFAARAGLLTASDAAAMLARVKKNGEEPVGRTELRLRLALEAMRGRPVLEPSYQSDYMRRGLEREPDAIGAYEALTGELVTPVGFLRHTSLPIGCSPDGLVEGGGVEVKCPKYTTHYDYLRQGTLPAEYEPQVMHSLLVSGLAWWDFVSWCPEFDGRARLFLVRAVREDFNLEAYELAVRFFWQEVEGVQTTLRALSAPEMTHV
jgi:hypothetical protein